MSKTHFLLTESRNLFASNLLKMHIEVITKKDLELLSEKIISEVVKAIDSSKEQTANEKELLTAKEVQDTLKISHTTLWNWSRKGIIKTHKIAGRLRYKRSEVLTALKRKEYKAG